MIKPPWLTTKTLLKLGCSVSHFKHYLFIKSSVSSSLLSKCFYSCEIISCTDLSRWGLILLSRSSKLLGGIFPPPSQVLKFSSISTDSNFTSSSSCFNRSSRNYLALQFTSLQLSPPSALKSHSPISDLSALALNTVNN